MVAKAKSPNAKSPDAQSQRELVITRVFEAQRKLVFQMWVDPKHVAQWWGPAGFTNPRCELDVRPGGTMRIDMRGPDGTVYPMTGVYHEIVEPERIVFSSSALDKQGKPLFEVQTTVTFAEQGGKTTLTLRAQITSTTDEGAPYLAGMEQGWTQSLERLQAHVAQARRATTGGAMSHGAPPSDTADREITITRVFDAPRELVFEAWTNPKHVVEWWGPNGFTTTTHEMNVTPGGVWRFIMHGPDGRDYVNKIVYDEVLKPERIVYSHTGDAAEPVQFQTTVTFADQGGRTKLTLRSLFPSAAERDRVVKEYGAEEGAHQTLARLAEYLPKM